MSEDNYCPECCEELDDDGSCHWCKREDAFREFAKENDLPYFPRPDGERYLYPVDKSKGSTHKKGERIRTMDEFWDAFVLAKGRPDLTILDDEDE